MNKRITMMLLAVIAATVSVHADVNTYTSDGTTFYFIVNSDSTTATITNKAGDCSSLTWSSVKNSYSTYYNSYSGAITIPETVNNGTNDYTVTTIGEFAFFYCTSLTSVTTPSTLTTVADYAFSHYSTSKTTKVTSVDLSASTSLSSIGSYAFIYCTSMTSIVFPEELDGDLTINTYAFRNCTSLTSIEMPKAKGSISIGSNCFYQCTKLASVTLSEADSIIIGSVAFTTCTKLATLKCKSTTLPQVDTSSTSTSAAFYNCSALTKIYVRPYLLAGYQSYTTTGSYKLWDNFDEGYFYPYYDLEVGDAGAATLCLPFTSTIPDDVTLYTLEEVGADKSDASQLAVTGTNITEDADTLTYDRPVYVTAEAGTYEFLGYYGGSDTDYHLSAQTETATEEMLTGVYQDTTISGYVYTLNDDGEFASATSVDAFEAYLTTERDLSVYSSTITFSSDGVDELSDVYAGKQCVCTVADEDGNNVKFYFVINDGLTTATITNSAYEDSSSVTWSTATGGGTYSGAISVPASVTDDNDTSEEPTAYDVTVIGDFAFLNCGSMTSVALPSTVTSIGYWTFAGTTATAAKVTSVDLSACTQLNSIGDYAFRYCESMTSITFPEEVSGDLEIGTSAFYYCTALTNVELPEAEGSVSIGYQCFINCSNLASVTLSEADKGITIGSNAFASCSNLATLKCKSTTLPQVDTSSASTSAAFFNCSALTKIYVRPYLLADYQNYTTTGTYTLWEFFNDGYFYPYYDLEVGDAGAATLCLPFTSIIPDSVKLYTLDKVTTSTNKYVAVGTDITDDADTLTYDRPVYVTAEAGTYEFLGYYGGSNDKYHLSEQTATATEGVLTGVYQATKASAGVYVLQDQGEGAKFYPVKSGSSITVGQFRAYLTYGEDSSAKSISFSLNDEEGEGDDNQTTDISGVSVAETSLDAVYTLQGVRVSEDNLQRGIYIRDGKKFVVK